MTDYFTPDIYPTFDDWWDLYGYKVDRKRCEKLWAKLSQKEKEIAMDHTSVYTQRTYTDGTYPSRRMPGTYLQNANWNDEALIRANDKPTKLASATEKADEYFAGRRTFANGNT